MAKLTEYVDELIQEVGPRPAGTQQEHQAAELIAARLDEFGMKVDIEEFPCARNVGWVRTLYYALCVAGAAISIFLTSFRLIGALLVIVGVVLMVLDYLGKNPLFSLFKSSLSQNVIARYLPPGVEPSGRTRKVVILAHYDSARTMVQAAPLLVPYYAQLRRVIRVMMVALIVLTLLMLAPFPDVVVTALSIIVGLVGLVVFLALLAEVVNFFMPYNQGANCNGSSIGVLYGLARALASGEDIVAHRAAATQGKARRTTRGEGSRRGSRNRRGATVAGGVELAAGAAAVTATAAGAAEDAPASRTGSRKKTDAAGGKKSVAGGLLSRFQEIGRQRDDSQAQDARASRPERTQRSAYDVQEVNPSAQDAGYGEVGTADTAGTAGTAVATYDAGAVGTGVAGAGAETAQSRRVDPAGKTDKTGQTGQIGQTVGQDARAGHVGAEPLPSRGVEGSVQSVGAHLVNPFISQRPPLTAIEEANRLREEERTRRLEEQQRRTQEAEGRTENGVPAWFVKAKKNAEKKAEHTRRDAKEPEVVRSRFADMPITGRMRKDDEAPEEAQTETEDTSQAADKTQENNETQAADVSEQTANESQATGEPQAADGSHQQATGEDGSHSADKPRQLIRDRSRMVAKQMVPSTPREPREEAEVQAPDEQRPASNTREAVPMTAKPDFSGLDRQAFKVLAAEEEGGGSVIVPTEVAAKVNAEATTGSDDASAGSGLGTTALRNRLRGLPNVSLDNTGNIPAQQATLDTEPVDKEDLFADQSSMVNATGAFVPLGTTGVIKPIGEDLLAYHEGGEVYIPDADDTAFSEQYSRTGEYSEPEPVNIPESRVKSFLGSVGDRLSGKKKEKLDDSPSSWLGVDKDFDARREGSEIGSWDNFNEDDDSWKGGAFGGANYDANVGAMMELSNELLDKEVWLVALGANESKNAGLDNLFANHNSELKSALFINLLGVGIGDLVFTVSEGNYRPAQTDHRMQSLISSAAQNMDIPIEPVEFFAFATDGTEALRRGGRAISLMGLGNQVPVDWRWSDDEVSRLKEDNLLDAAAILVETIKNS
jgi:hypothetical protein